MDDFSSISLLSLAMLVGCYVAGIIPLAVNFSEVSSDSLIIANLNFELIISVSAVSAVVSYSVLMIYEQRRVWCVCVNVPIWAWLQEKLKLVTVLGAGLLCGTALAVIIPEGVHALYEEILEGKVQMCYELFHKAFFYSPGIIPYKILHSLYNNEHFCILTKSSVYLN